MSTHTHYEICTDCVQLSETSSATEFVGNAVDTVEAVQAVERYAYAVGRHGGRRPSVIVGDDGELLTDAFSKSPCDYCGSHYAGARFTALVEDEPTPYAVEYADVIEGELLDVEGRGRLDADSISTWLVEDCLEVVVLATADGSRTRVEVLRTYGGPGTWIYRDDTDGGYVVVHVVSAGDEPEYRRVFAPTVAGYLDALAGDLVAH